MKKTYVWYSAATDVTGKKLVEELGCSGGTAKPTAKFDKIICWGTKTKDNVDLAQKTVFNHPNNIRVNRNKLSALVKMKAADCNVADFDEDNKTLDFPMIARTKYHQGGAGFWLCLNAAQVTKAAEEGAQYYQEYIDIKDEYRLHVVGGEVIYAVKKVARKNLKDAFVNHYTEHIKNYAVKKDINVDDDTIEFVMRRMARKMATSVDMIVRSNTRGWKFSRVDINTLDAGMKEQAVKAVDALGLTYGAVDCCISNDGGSFIIECNTGPGLSGSSFKAWTTALIKLVENVGKKKAKPVIVKKGVKKLAKDEIKKKLAAQAKMMEAMLEQADDDEMDALNNIWQKMGLA